MASPPLGDKLLQIANGIIEQERGRQQMALQVAQFENQVKQQKVNFDLQQKEIDLRERNFELQTQQEARLGASSDVANRLGEVDILLKQRELGTPLGSTGEGLKETTVLKLREEVFQEMEAAAVNRVVDQTIGSFQGQKPQEGVRPEVIASRFPRFSSVQEYNKFRSEIALLQKQIDAGTSVLDFLKNSDIDLPIVGKVNFDSESEARAYTSDMQRGLDELRKTASKTSSGARVPGTGRPRWYRHD